TLASLTVSGLTTLANLTVTGTSTFTNLAAKTLDLRNAGLMTQLHISSANNDSGFAIVNNNNNTNLASGAYHDGTNWIAKVARPIMIQYETGSPYLNIFSPITAATVGAAVTWDLVCRISGLGGVECGQSAGVTNTRAN